MSTARSDSTPTSKQRKRSLNLPVKSIYPKRQKEIEKRQKARLGSKEASTKRKEINMRNKARGDRFEKFLSDFLHLDRQIGSGSGCIEKEDLRNARFLFQLKGTKGKSFSVKLCDLEKLMASAKERDLDPVFVFGFERRDKFVPSRTFVAVPLSVWMEIK